MPNFLSKLFKILGSLFVRAGVDRFIKEHLQDAVKLIEELALEQSGAPFHDWKIQVRERLTTQFKSVADNWLELLIGFAFEHYKATKGAKYPL